MRGFVVTMILGPIACLLMLALLAGMGLKHEGARPLCSGAGLLVFALFETSTAERGFHRAARLSLIFVKVGLGLDGGASYFLPRLCGLRAYEIALTGDNLAPSFYLMATAVLSLIVLVLVHRRVNLR